MTGHPVLDKSTGLPAVPVGTPTLAIDVTRIVIADQRVPIGDPVSVEVEIFVGGPDRANCDASFDVTVYGEGLGPVADKSITPTLTPLVLSPGGPASGAFTITLIPAGALEYPNCEQYVGTVEVPAGAFTDPGSYKLVVSLTLTSPQPAGTMFVFTHDIQAFTDGPVVNMTP